MYRALLSIMLLIVNQYALAVVTKVDFKLMNERSSTVYGCHTKLRVSKIRDAFNFEYTYINHYNLKPSDPDALEKIMFQQERDIYTHIMTYGKANTVFWAAESFKSCVKKARNQSYKSPETINYVTQYEIDAMYCYDGFIDDMDALQWLRNDATPSGLIEVFASPSKPKDDALKHLVSLKKDMDTIGLIETQRKIYDNYLYCTDNVHNRYQDEASLKQRARGY